jgi:hypothetical protein
MPNASFDCRSSQAVDPRADHRPRAVAVMGPTASGKTDFAAVWAQHLDTEVISVDSALVYRRLDIGSAKPDAATLARAPHRQTVPGPSWRRPWQRRSSVPPCGDADAAPEARWCPCARRCRCGRFGAAGFQNRAAIPRE